MGISEILGGCSPLVVDRCEKLVLYVRRIRWCQVSAKNRILPTETGTVAPVYDNGDYVEFDVDGWKPMVPAKMLVNTRHVTRWLRCARINRGSDVRLLVLVSV